MVAGRGVHIAVFSLYTERPTTTHAQLGHHHGRSPPPLLPSRPTLRALVNMPRPAHPWIGSCPAVIYLLQIPPRPYTFPPFVVVCVDVCCECKWVCRVSTSRPFCTECNNRSSKDRTPLPTPPTRQPASLNCWQRLTAPYNPQGAPQYLDERWIKRGDPQGWVLCRQPRLAQQATRC